MDSAWAAHSFGLRYEELRLSWDMDASDRPMDRARRGYMKLVHTPERTVHVIKL